MRLARLFITLTLLLWAVNLEGQVQPERPVPLDITQGFGTTPSWSNKPHNGIDYVSPLTNQLLSVGPGGIISPIGYTGPSFASFGSIDPDRPGPAIWMKYMLATNEPIYVLYGHTATSWIDNSTGAGTKSFKFDVTYTVRWTSGDQINEDTVVGATAPFYLRRTFMPHLHVSVFKPKRVCKNNTYCEPPSKGWGYSDIHQRTGDYINPEDFFTKPEYRLFAPSNQPPTAGFTMTAGAQSAIEGQTLIVTVPPGTNANVSFDGSRSHDPEDGAAISFEWTLDGQLVSTVGAFASPLAAGTHVISLVVRDSAGLPSPAAQGTIAIQNFPPRIIQIGDTLSGLQPFEVGLSRDGSTAVFYDVGGGRLFSVPSDGTTVPVSITPPGLNVLLPGVSFFPRFSGAKVVFTGQSPSGGCCTTGEIYVVNPDGTGLMPLTADGDPFGGFFGARISADGRIIAFDGPFIPDTIYIMNSDGTNRHSLLLPRSGFGGRPGIGSLTSDGSRMAYGCFSPGSTSADSLCLINTDGTGFQQIVIGGEIAGVVVSGDGTTIVYGGGTHGVEVIKTDGTGQRVVAPTGGGFLSITYNGSTVCSVAAAAQFPNSDVFCINTDGTNLRNLTTPPGGGDSNPPPAISENGAVVALISAADLDPGKNTDHSWAVFAAHLSPSLAIDGGAASVRAQGETFTFTAFGFEPNGPITRRVRQPNGVEITLSPPMNADTVGKLSWTFQSACGTAPGTYLLWAIDETTGRISNTVTETITPNPACP